MVAPKSKFKNAPSNIQPPKKRHRLVFSSPFLQRPEKLPNPSFKEARQHNISLPRKNTLEINFYRPAGRPVGRSATYPIGAMYSPNQTS